MIIKAEVFLDKVKEKGKKMAIVFVRASPIMEIMTGIIIAILIYYSGKLVMSDEIEISNFFSFLAAMMLAYQPVRSLATLNIALNKFWQHLYFRPAIKSSNTHQVESPKLRTLLWEPPIAPNNVVAYPSWIASILILGELLCELLKYTPHSTPVPILSM